MLRFFVLTLASTLAAASTTCYSCTTCVGTFENDCWLDVAVVSLNFSGVLNSSDCSSNLAAVPVVACETSVCMEYCEDCDSESGVCSKCVRGCHAELTGVDLNVTTLERCESGRSDDDEVDAQFHLCSTDRCNGHVTLVPDEQCRTDLPKRNCESCTAVQGSECSALPGYQSSSCSDNWCVNTTTVSKLTDGTPYSVQFSKNCVGINLFGIGGCTSTSTKFTDFVQLDDSCTCNDDDRCASAS